MRLLITALLAFAVSAGSSMAADLKILSAGAYKPAAQVLAADFEKKTGNRVTIVTDTAGGLGKRLAAGEYFDIVVMPALVMGPYLGSRLDESSAKALARAGVGVAVKKGAAKPDLSTTESFKQALLSARAIAYIDPAAGGSSGIYLAQLFDQMGITQQLKAKSILVKGGLVAEVVASGQADIGMQQLSELMGQPGVDVAGPLPLFLQNYTLYSGAISTGTGNRAAADALLLALANPSDLHLLRRVGLSEP